MIKKLLFPLLITGLGTLQAQNSFSDDFESYKVGDYVAKSSPNWTVWSGAAGEGTQEDAFVTDENARSGTKSIKLEAASSAGGPTDLVLPFGGELNLGIFRFEMWIYVIPDQAAYFNFQGKQTIGQIWAFDAYFDGDGQFRGTLGSAANGDLFEVPYFPGEWQKFNLVADLTNNNWEVFLNDVSVSKFTNPNNSIASLDLYPNYVTGAVTRGNGSTFYVDDVSYHLEPYNRPNLEATLLKSNYKPRFLAGESSAGSIDIRNLGTTVINSLEVSTRIGAGTPEITNLTNLNIAPLAIRTINLPKVSYAPGTSNLEVSILKVNDQADDDQTNNSKVASILGVVPAPHKVMVAEEATGTWCQWCPRGAVFMDSMERTYHKYFAGIAVHGGSATEPMRVPIYDAGLTATPGFVGFPSTIIDRKTISDPLFLESDFYDNIVVETPVKLTNGATWNPTTGDLVVSVKADFLKDVSGDYRFNMVLVENNVKGNTAAYNQANAYSGGRNGPMGGFESLPNPVPAARMTYNHVARIIMDGYDGLAGYLPNNIAAGSTYHITYTTNLPVAWKEDNIEIIGLMYGPVGEIVNATKTSIAEAVANGLYTSTENPSGPISQFGMAPNPASEESQVSLNLETPTQMNLEVLDITGKTLMSRNYGIVQGDLVFPIQTASLQNGVYTIRITLDGQAQTKKLVVNH